MKSKNITKKNKYDNENQLKLNFKKIIKKKNKDKNPKDISLFQNSDFSILSRITVSSIVVISLFSIIPLFINFADNNFNKKEFANNSKKILAYTLNSKNQIKDDSEVVNEDDLLFDIFSLNNLESDTVRLSASTIKQLFEDTDYNLKDVRKKKLVKPVALTLLPQEIKMIESTKKRKDFFIQIVLPLIIKENNNIRTDRKTLFNIIIFFYN